MSFSTPAAHRQAVGTEQQAAEDETVGSPRRAAAETRAAAAALALLRALHALLHPLIVPLTDLTEARRAGAACSLVELSGVLECLLARPAWCARARGLKPAATRAHAPTCPDLAKA